MSILNKKPGKLSLREISFIKAKRKNNVDSLELLNEYDTKPIDRIVCLGLGLTALTALIAIAPYIKFQYDKNTDSKPKAGAKRTALDNPFAGILNSVFSAGEPGKYSYVGGAKVISHRVCRPDGEILNVRVTLPIDPVVAAPDIYGEVVNASVKPTQPSKMTFDEQGRPVLDFEAKLLDNGRQPAVAIHTPGYEMSFIAGTEFNPADCK